MWKIRCSSCLVNFFFQKCKYLKKTNTESRNFNFWKKFLKLCSFSGGNKMIRFSQTWSKYLEVSSIHGLVYLSRKNSTKYAMWLFHWLFEIFICDFCTFCDFSTFWICSLLLSATIFFLLIFKTTEKFLADQTIVRIADKSIAIADIPFPAITICSDSLIHRAVKNFENVTKNISEEK